MTETKNICKKEIILKRIRSKSGLKIMNVFIYIALFTIAIMLSFYSNSNAKAQNYSNLNKYSFKKNIYTHKLAIKPNIIYRLNTALGYVSIITLPVIPLNVAIGNASAFSEQIIGNQIFIKPITYNLKTATNLEILTKYGLINILVRIANPRHVTYNLDLSSTSNNIFVKNYIKSKIEKESKKMKKMYNQKLLIINQEKTFLLKQKNKIMDLILRINRSMINKTVRKEGIILTAISISHIRNLDYLQYQITNTNNKPLFIRNIYLYFKHGGSFWNGYAPIQAGEVYLINKTPHNKKYMPYQIIKNVAIFNRFSFKKDSKLVLSVHLLFNRKLVKLKINNIPSGVK